MGYTPGTFNMFDLFSERNETTDLPEALLLIMYYKHQITLH